MSSLFLNPALLWGLCSLAIPFAIHLLLRRRPRIEYWGATRFLKSVIEKKQTQLQFLSITQLLVRAAILLFIVLAVSEPKLGIEQTRFDIPDRQHHLLILDVSMSVAARENGQPRFESIRQQVTSLVAQAPQGDSWQLLLYGTAQFPNRIRVPTYNPEVVLDEISQLKISAQSGSLIETLQNALTYVEEFPGNRNEVLFWSDFNQTDWKLTDPQKNEIKERLEQLSHAANIAFIDVSRQQVANSAVTGLSVVSPRCRVGQPAEVEVTLTNFSRKAISTSVQLELDGEPVAEKSVTLQPEETRYVSFEVLFNRPGVSHCEARISEDPLLEDNRRMIAVPIFEATRVLVVEEPFGSEGKIRQSDFLELALQPVSESAPSRNKLPNSQGHYVVSKIRPDQFRTTNLEDFDVLLICEFPNLSIVDAQRITGFVKSGGGVLFSMSPSVSLNQYNALLGPQGEGLLPMELMSRINMDSITGKPFLIDRIAQEHPLLRPFNRHPEAGLLTTRVYTYIASKPYSNVHAEVVAELDSKAALIVEHSVGLGKIYLVTTSFDIEWGSWVLWPSFLPMIQRAVDDLAAPRNLVIESTIGQDVPEGLISADLFDFVQAAKEQIIWEKETGADAVQILFDDILTEPGIYRFQSRLPRKTIQIVDRQFDSHESYLEQFDTLQFLGRELQESLNIDVVENVKTLVLQRQVQDASGESSLSRWLLLFAVLLLSVDLIFACNVRLGVGVLVGILLSVVLFVGTQNSLTIVILQSLVCIGLCAFLGISADLFQWQRQRRLAASGTR